MYQLQLLVQMIPRRFANQMLLFPGKMLRGKSAAREVGNALGFNHESLERLSSLASCLGPEFDGLDQSEALRFFVQDLQMNS